MPQVHCPVCDHVTTYPEVFVAGPCPACGYDLLRQAGFSHHVIDGVNIPALAAQHRVLRVCLLLNVLAHGVQVLSFVHPPARGGLADLCGPLFPGAILCVSVWCAANVFRALPRRLGAPPPSIAWLALLPVLSVFILLAADSSAAGALRRAGLRPGWLGVSRARLRSHFAPGHCRTCGYIVVASTATCCPECGTPIPPDPSRPPPANT